MGNTSGRRVKGAGNDNTGHMVNGDHVHGIVDVRPAVDLDAAKTESNEEIVVVGNLIEEWLVQLTDRRR